MMDEDRIVKIAINGYWRDASPKAREDARWHLVCALTALHEAGLVVEQGWQPISTVPQTGDILAAEIEDGEFCEIDAYRLFNDRWLCFSSRNYTMREKALEAFSHWRPLPAPPAAKADPQ